MKENYRAWDIHPKDFPQNGSLSDQIRFLVRFAVLAPSSHNSQPWRFSVSGSRLFLSPDFSRALRVSDKLDRQLYISLGCALNHLLIAGDYYGLYPTVEFNEGKESSVSIFFEPSKHRKEKKYPLVKAMIHRRCNRSPYGADPLPESVQTWLNQFSSDDLQIHLLERDQEKQAIADLLISANDEAFGDKGFREELYQYVKPNTTDNPLCMPAFSMGIPTPVSYIVPTMLRHFNMAKLGKKTEQKLFTKQTPRYVAITTTLPTPKHWIMAGELYERISLLAAKHGFSTQPLGAAIEIGNHGLKLKDLLQTPHHPTLLFRLGKPNKQAKASPRLLAKHVIV